MLLLLATACGGNDIPTFGSSPGGGSGGDDDRLAPPDEGFQVVLSDLEIPPDGSVFFCQFGTYQGEDAGVVGVRIQETLPYTHHTFLLEVPAEAEVPVADGVTFPCTDLSLGEQMLPFMPLFNLAGEIEDPLANRLTLPDGFGVHFDKGQRFVIETHYVNTSDEVLEAETVVNVEFVDAAEIDTWAAAYLMDAGIVSAEAGTRARQSFSCSFPDDAFILSMTPHLHKYGDSVGVEYVSGDTADTLIDLPEWDPYWTQDPREIMLNWGEGEFLLSPEDSIATSCEWFNSSDADLEPLAEMCTTFGMFYPSDRKYTCIDGEVQDF
jgi:hypothetical protein